eukprot:COSAG05_NODE_1299_length_5244_cov_93.435180_1_plen_115_part_00
MDSSNDFLLAQEDSHETYGPGEQMWLICLGQEHKTAVSVEHLRRSRLLLARPAAGRWQKLGWPAILLSDAKVNQCMQAEIPFWMISRLAGPSCSIRHACALSPSMRAVLYTSHA